MKHTRSRWKLAIAWFCVFCIAIAFSTSALADTVNSSSDTSAYNIVLLIDKSGSMNGTDPNRLAVDASSLFVDSFYAESTLYEGTSGDHVSTKVSVLAYSLDVETIAASVELSTDAEVDYVTDCIDSIEYIERGTGGTDHGLAVLTAAQLLQRTNDGTRKNIIVLFTDGKTEGTDEAISATQLEEGLNLANEIGCEIYSIGLNSNGFADLSVIADIANRTQLSDGVAEQNTTTNNGFSGVNYSIVETCEEVQSFYMALSAKLFGTTSPIPVPPDGNNYYINVDTPQTYAINIYILSPEDEIGEITLTNPTGVEVDINSNNVRTARGHGYTLMTIRYPDIGTWTIRTEGNVTYDVSYIPIIGITMNLNTTTSGQHGHIEVSLESDGQPMTPDTYSKITNSTCTITSFSNGSSQTIDMIYDSKSNLLTADFAVDKPGTYTLEAAVSMAQMEREVSTDVQFTVDCSTETVKVPLFRSRTINLHDYMMPGWDSVTLTANQVVPTPDNIAKTTLKDNKLVLFGKRLGSATVSIQGIDSLGQFRQCDMNIIVRLDVIFFLPLILIVLALLALAFLKFRPALHGDFHLECIYNGNECINEERPCPLKGQSFTLYSLLQAFIGDDDYGDVRRLMNVLEENQQELKSAKYKIRISKRQVGKKSIPTYLYGPSGRRLEGEIYRDDDNIISINLSYDDGHDENDFSDYDNYSDYSFSDNYSDYD